MYHDIKADSWEIGIGRGMPSAVTYQAKNDTIRKKSFIIYQWRKMYFLIILTKILIIIIEQNDCHLMVKGILNGHGQNVSIFNS